MPNRDTSNQEKSKTMKNICMPLLLLLTGCATRTVYMNPNLSDGPAVQRQFAIDDGYCIGAANGSVPMPEVRIYSPGQDTYRVTGTVIGPNGVYRYSGQGTSGGQNFASGFATGFANGASIGTAMAARDVQRRVYHGCMVSLGWEAAGAKDSAQTTSCGSTPSPGCRMY